MRGVPLNDYEESVMRDMLRLRARGLSYADLAVVCEELYELRVSPDAMRDRLRKRGAAPDRRRCQISGGGGVSDDALVDALARVGHDAYESYSRAVGHVSGSPVPWEDVPEPYRGATLAGYRAALAFLTDPARGDARLVPVTERPDLSRERDRLRADAQGGVCSICGRTAEEDAEPQIRSWAASCERVKAERDEARAERDTLRAALTRIYQRGTGEHVEIARRALNGEGAGRG